MLINILWTDLRASVILGRPGHSGIHNCFTTACKDGFPKSSPLSFSMVPFHCPAYRKPLTIHAAFLPHFNADTFHHACSPNLPVCVPIPLDYSAG